MDDSVDSLISALENETRREILRRLTIEQTYAFEISRFLGVSQQAINKQLSFLENARLIASVGVVPSIIGAPRKIYKPTGFSTVIIDYSRNFLDTRSIPLEFPDTDVNASGNKDSGGLIRDLKSVNAAIEDLMKERTVLVRKKDAILEVLRKRVLSGPTDRLSRDIIEKYLQVLDESAVAEKLGVPENIVRYVIENYF